MSSPSTLFEMRSLHFYPQHTPGCESIHPTWAKVAWGHRWALPHQALGGSRNSKFKPLSTEPAPQPICCFLSPDSLTRLSRPQPELKQFFRTDRPPKELDYGATLLVSKRFHLLPDLFLSGEALPFSCLPSIYLFPPDNASRTGSETTALTSSC